MKNIKKLIYLLQYSALNYMFSSPVLKNKIPAIIILLLSVILLSCSTETKYTAIDIRPFENSAHHWYDIYSNDNIIEPKKDQPKYTPDQIIEIADNILLYQNNNGGWPKNYDMLAILTDAQKDSLLQNKNKTETTFDNWNTHSQVEYLANVYFQSKIEKYKNACLRGIDFILSAQYPNGGWPQFYPDTSGYRKYITFNDGVFAGIMTTLKNILDKKPYFSFVEDDRIEKIKTAYGKGLECILNCQIVDNGQLTVWCQQHDNIDLKPQWARAFEPPSICNNESAAVVLFLMSIDNPDQKIVSSIEAAVKWFGESKISGIKVKVIPAPTVKYRWSTSSIDKIVVKDPEAPPIWPRYNELGTHRPLFCNRDSKVVYSLDKVDRERRSGYGWYTYQPQLVLDEYPAWREKWDPDVNVLN